MIKSFVLTKRFYPLIFIPIFLDLIQLRDIMQRVQQFHIKFTVPSAIPSVTQILADIPNKTNGFSVNMPFSNFGGIAIFMFALYLITSSFLTGGFLGCVLAGIKEDEVSINLFIQYGKKFFSRFLLKFFITFGSVLVIALIISSFGPILLLLFIGFLIFFFFLSFWDFVMVAEDETLINAAIISINLVRNNIGNVISFLLPIALITSFLAILANFIVTISIVGAIIAIVVYAYYGTAIIFMIMSYYIQSSSLK